MLDETRNQLQTSKNQHLRQIEIMESEELIAQKKVRSEMIQMEDVLAQIRKEYEMLRIQFEQNLAANEQTAPINREMRHLITSLQNHHTQLKGESTRNKTKWKDATAELLKFKKDYDELVAKLNATDGKKADVKQEGAVVGVKEESSSDPSVSTKEEAGGSTVKSKSAYCFESVLFCFRRIYSHVLCTFSAETDQNDEETEEIDGIKKEAGSACVKQEKDNFNANLADKKDGQNATPKVEKEPKDAQRTKELKITESEMVRDLKTQLK